MATEGWIALLALLAGFALALGNWPLLFLACLALLTLVASWAWGRSCLRGVRYERSFEPARVFPGEPTELTLRITNGKLLPLAWLRLEQLLPAELEPLQPLRRVVDVLGRWPLLRTTALGPYERVAWRLRLTVRRRGSFALGPAALETGDPLGFYQRRLEIEERASLLVYPAIVRPPEVGLPDRFPFGPRSLRTFDPPDPLEVVGARDYRPGDPFRLVDWKATARRGKLQTRVLRPTRLQAVLLLLDVRTARAAWEGIDPERLEAAISVAAGLAEEAVRQRYPVGLAANTVLGPGADAVLPPDRSPASLERILELLARLAPMALVPCSDLACRLGRALPFGAAVVAVSGLVDDDLVGALVSLRRQARSVALVSLDPQPVPTPPDIPLFPVDLARLGLALTEEPDGRRWARPDGRAPARA